VNVPKSSKITPSVPRSVSWTSKLLFSRPRSLLLHCHELAVQPAHSKHQTPALSAFKAQFTASPLIYISQSNSFNIRAHKIEGAVILVSRRGYAAHD
jgi:hypothetical protein